ncbi:MAG: hypothetical protein EOO22_12225, partial [Comamonadaceae bacterium]
MHAAPRKYAGKRLQGAYIRWTPSSRNGHRQCQQHRRPQPVRDTPKTAAAAALRERLRQALPATVELLQQRQADRIDDADIEAYVGLNWLEWQ